MQTRLPAARLQHAAAAAATTLSAPAAPTAPAPKPGTRHSALEQSICSATTIQELSDVLALGEQEQQQEQQRHHEQQQDGPQSHPAQTHIRGLAARPLRHAARRVLQLLQGGQGAPAHVPDPAVPNPGMRGAGVHGKGPVVEVLAATRGKLDKSVGSGGTAGSGPGTGRAGTGERGWADGKHQEQQQQQQRMAAAKELLGWIMRRTGALVAGAEGGAAAAEEGGLQGAAEAAQGPQPADGDAELLLLLLQLVCCFAHLGAWVPWSEDRALWAAGGAPEDGQERGEAGAGSRQDHRGRGRGDERGPQARSGLERLWAALLRQVCAADPGVGSTGVGKEAVEGAGLSGMQGRPLAPCQLLWAVWAAAYSAPQALPALLRSLAEGGGGGQSAEGGRPVAGGGAGGLAEALRGLEALSDVQLVSVLWSAGQ